MSFLSMQGADLNTGTAGAGGRAALLSRAWSLPPGPRRHPGIFCVLEGFGESGTGEEEAKGTDFVSKSSNSAQRPRVGETVGRSVVRLPVLLSLPEEREAVRHRPEQPRRRDSEYSFFSVVGFFLFLFKFLFKVVTPRT